MEEKEVVGVAMVKVGVKADILVVQAAGVDITRIVVGTIRVGVGMVWLGIERADVKKIGVGGAGVGKTGMRRAGIREVDVGGAGIFLIGVSIDGSETGSRSRPA